MPHVGETDLRAEAGFGGHAEILRSFCQKLAWEDGPASKGEPPRAHEPVPGSSLDFSVGTDLVKPMDVWETSLMMRRSQMVGDSSAMG